MSSRVSSIQQTPQPRLEHRKKRSLPTVLAGIGTSLGVIILVCAVLIFVFGRTILNGYGKHKLEWLLAEAHPGCALQIGDLDYSAGANCLIARSATLTTSNSIFKVGRISLTGVGWVRLILGTAELPEILAKASLDATNLDIEFPLSKYGIRCARLHASVPRSELFGERAELQSLVKDESLFAASDFRTTRYHVIAPEFKVSGLVYGELLQGKSCRASAIHFFQPSFEALVNRDKPSPPFGESPPMVHEALAAIRCPIQLDRLTIAGGHVSYCERMVVGADPAC